MATAAVEQGTPHGPDRQTFMEWLKKIFEQILHKRKLDEGEAEEAQRQMRAAEVKAERDEANRRKREEDKQRAYRERQTGEDRVENLDQAKVIRREQVKEHLQEFISAQGRAGSGYLYEIVRDTAIRQSLNDLIDRSAGAASLLDKLATQEKELHGDPVALINLGQSLLYEAERVPGGKDAVSSLITGLKQRIVKLLPEAIVRTNENARTIGGKNFGQRLIEDLDLKLTNEQIKSLLNTEDPGTQETTVNTILTTPSVKPTQKDPGWAEIRNESLGTGNEAPASALVREVEEVWQEVERSEKAGSHLSADKLQEVERKILASESKALPKDVIPGTQAYNNVVVASHRFVEDRLKKLAVQLGERLKTDSPPVRAGITNTSEFLKEMVRHKGHLGELLAHSPDMEKLLVGKVPNTKADIERSVRFRNQVFLTIHSAILTDKRVSSNENFGLYERADFTTFSDILRSSMADLIRSETGTAYGQTWVDWYVNLSNTIRLSRDIDFWAAQPGASIDDFGKSLALFQNDYSVQALSIPAVEQAFRAYESTLRSIRNSNDGYIPPALIGYSSSHMDSYWDRTSQQMLEKMIKTGVVYDVDRDPGGFHRVEADGNTVKTGNKLDIETLQKEDPQNLELSMYMTLAKGFGMASLRFLEMFANSKVPGSQQPGFAMGGFHSTPYEGPARALNYFSTMIHKWKFGSYKYMHMMNTLLPDEHKIRHIDMTEPMKAYVAYRDGTFVDKYGEEAKRLYDQLNFSGASSAFGPPYTTWRHLDITIGWSDKQRELLGGPTQIMFSSKFAGEKVKEYLVTGKFKEEFRQLMREAGKPASGTEFDRLWLERGLPNYEYQIDSEWKEMQKKHKDEIKHLTDSYKRAFIARVWVETAMRNPLAVAHNLEVEVPDGIPGKKRKIRLHSYIAQQVLGIPLEDTKYGEIAGKAAPESSPTEKQRRYMAEVMDLEGDLAAVREIAISNNRELTDDDFKIIKSVKNREQAIKYWQMTRQFITGSSDADRYKQLYADFGMALSENGTDYDLNWKKIKEIEKTLDHLSEHNSGYGVSGGKVILNEKLVDKNWDNVFGSDDTAYRQMAVLNLGPRQWVRRGGDAQAHYHGGERAGKYLTANITPNPNPEDLAKALLELRQIYEGDAIEAGWQVAGLLAHATSRLYSFDYGRLGSAAQLDVWKTRRNVAAWTANGRRAFWDALEHLDVLPPVGEAWNYNVQQAYSIPHDIHELRKLNRAAGIDIAVEILTLGIALAILMTLWRAFTAKSEEEEGGGESGGHH